MVTQELLNKMFDYDPRTGLLIRKSSGEEAGTVKKNGTGNLYRQVRIAGKIYYTHRLVFLMVEGKFPDEQVDHINGNGLDNSWTNLRKVSNEINGKNVKLHSTNTSGQVGVRWYAQRSRWIAVIFVGGRSVYLGSYLEFNRAVEARKAAEVRYGFHENHGTLRSFN